MEKAREIWWEKKDAWLAIRSLRKAEKSIEGKILLTLARLGSNAYVNALEIVST